MPVTCSLPLELREQAKALYLQGLSTTEISQETGVQYGTVRAWISRGDWRTLRNDTRSKLVTAKERAVSRHITLVQSPARMPDNKPSRLRGAVSRELEAQVAVLEQNPPSSLQELKNTPEREGRASMVKRIAETAALVENWEDQHAPGIIVMMENMQPIEERSIQGVTTVDLLPEATDPASEAIRALQED